MNENRRSSKVELEAQQWRFDLACGRPLHWDGLVFQALSATELPKELQLQYAARFATYVGGGSCSAIDDWRCSDIGRKQFHDRKVFSFLFDSSMIHCCG